MSTVNISVIIPCFNAEKFIEKCINSIEKASPRPKEIIIIDDCSTDNSNQVLSRLKKKKVKVLLLQNNSGPAIARNKGAKIATGKYLLFLDADTTVAIKIFKEVYLKMEGSPTWGALQGKIINAHTQKLETAGHFLAFNGFPYEIGVNENPDKYKEEIEIFGARSACLTIRKDIFEKIGGFDEDYFIYGEETDLCWRIWLAGYKIFFYPRAIANHFGKSTLNAKTKYRVLYEGAKNNTSNILKNASIATMIYMLPAHILTWITICLFQLIRLRFTSSFNLLNGLLWNIIHFEKTIKKRSITKTRHSFNFGQKLPFSKIFIKGYCWIKNV